MAYDFDNWYNGKPLPFDSSPEGDFSDWKDGAPAVVATKLTTLDATLPDLEVSASGYTEAGTLSATLPDLEVTASGYQEGGTLNENLPDLEIAASGGHIGYCHATLPDLRISATFEAAERYSEYRLYINDVQGGAGITLPSINELEFRTTPGGADQSTGATASASHEVFSYEADNLIDDTISTRWTGNCTDAERSSDSVWVQVTFDSELNIVEYTLKAPGKSAGGSADDTPIAWKLYKRVVDTANDPEPDRLLVDTVTTTADWSKAETRTFGVPRVDATLPDLEISATGYPNTGQVDATLSDLEVSASGGHKPFCFATLPDLEISAAGSNGPVLKCNLPALQISAVTGATATLDVNLPDLECSASSTTVIGQTADPLNLPDLEISATMSRMVEVDALLPTVGCTARFGERGNAAGKLPDLECAAYSAATMSTSVKLPDLECSATALSGAFGSLNKKLPDLEVETRIGSRADDLTLPDLEATGSILLPVGSDLNKTLPGISVNAELTVPIPLSLDKDLTFPLVSASATEHPLLNVSVSLPGLVLSASGLSGATGDLDATLSDLEISASSLTDFLTLNGTLPALLVAYASGDSDGAGDNTLTDATRFDDYLLRHSRW